MESQTGESMVALSESIEQMEARMGARIEAAAALFERAATLFDERESSMSGEVRKIVAAVETTREAELQKKLEAAEQQIAELRAQMESQTGAKSETPAKAARKTVPASTAQFLAKQGITSLESLEAGALDAALSGLGLEQRIAVKAQLLRAGVVS
jgi:ABC-type Fe3+-citrate transport system substrate-binding protein